MVQRGRVFPPECGAADAPLRVNDCQFALGFESANLRKNRPDKSGRYACSGVNEYSGMSAAQPMRRCWLTIASLPLDSKARI